MNKDTCETCVYWDRSKYEEWWGRCTNMLIGEMSMSGNPKQKQICLDYDYNEGGKFMMGKDFGCVHHQPYEGKRK